MTPTVPHELLQAIARGNAVAFVGSGPSINSGFPSWPKLLELILEFGTTDGIEVSMQSDIRQLIDAQNFLLAAEALRANIGAEKWFNFLRKTFDKPNAPLTEVHRLLFRIPFAAAATTNYETLVERAFDQSRPNERFLVFTQIDHTQLGTALNSKQFFVLKAHGTIERPETIVLTQSDYARLIHNSAGYRAFLKALFLDRTVLFLGFGLNDPELGLLLEELREIFQGRTSIHYALFDVRGTTATEQENFESHYGIRVLPYTPGAADHPEVAQFLEEILAKLPRYILNHTMNAALKPAREVLDSDSHYRLVMNSDNEFSIREKYDGAIKDKPLKFTVGFEFDEQKETDREAHQALQRLFTEGEPVTIKSPHLSKFVPPEVLLPLMPEKITDMEITIGNVKTNQVFMVRVIMEPKNGPAATLDNIALKKIRGGSEKATVSNQDQDVPWKLTQIISVKENSSQLQLSCHCVNLPIKQALKVQRFWDALSRGGQLRIEAEKTDAQIGRSTVEAGAFDSPDPQMIKILEALEIIQSKTEVMFTAPASVSAHAARHIWSVAQIVNTGIATMMPPEMNFTVQEVKEMFPKFASGAKMVMQQFVDEWGAIVLNKRVSLGPVLISCDELHVSSEDRERAMNDIEGHSPDHVISVKVSPVEGTAIEAKFMAWLPEAQADAIRNMPFVRSASLNNMIQNLREASLDTNGAFNVDEFMKLLAEAKAESTNKEIVISPLLLATEQDLVQAFKAILETIAPAQRNALAARLVEAGWLRE